jgi:hypothetical protein
MICGIAIAIPLCAQEQDQLVVRQMLPMYTVNKILLNILISIYIYTSITIYIYACDIIYVCAFYDHNSFIIIVIMISNKHSHIAYLIHIILQ